MKNIYVIRHKESGKLLQNTWPKILTKLEFKDWGIPKIYADLKYAKEQLILIDQLMFIDLESSDLEIVNTHNSIEKEKWTVITD